jgi:hypothetical protein
VKEKKNARQMQSRVQRPYLVDEFVSSDDSLVDPDFDVANIQEIQSSSSDDDDESAENLQKVCKRKKPGQDPDVTADSSEATASGDKPPIGFFDKRPVRGSCKNSCDKTNFCIFCGTAIKSKICRHILNVHKNEQRVMDILLLPNKCKERIKLLNQLANEGNFNHNVNALRCGEGQLVVGRRNAGGSRSATQFLPREFCKKFIAKSSLWRHFQYCQLRLDYYARNEEKVTADAWDEENVVADVANGKKRTVAVRRSRILLSSVLVNDGEDVLAYLFERMRDDTVKQLVVSDDLIRSFGCLRMESLGQKSVQKLADVNRVS